MMAPKYTQLNVKLDDLVLDVNNPRFAELYSGSEEEDDLIEYLLYTEAAEEVAEKIHKAREFYQDRPLWVVKQEGKYLVKDGNRRCSAVKALQMPGKYKLSLPKTPIEEVPVLLYNNLKDVEERIVDEHAGGLFRRWERIAKALEVLKLFDNGKSEEAYDLDSKPGDLIKLATFYKEAVKYGKDDLKQLLRRGKGKTGGKTIIFERLFRDYKLCGYMFKNSPSFRIEITDGKKFAKYVMALVKYLKEDPDEITAQKIDKDKSFLKKLKPYGFDAYAKTPTEQNTGNQSNDTGNSSATSGNDTQSGTAGEISSTSGNQTQSGYAGDNNQSTSSGATNTGGGSNSNGSSTNQNTGTTRGSTKKQPSLKRKQLSAGLKARIKEYFDLDADEHPNSKIAMARVTFECVLKYVVEETKFNTRTAMSKSGHFGPVYANRRFTDFNQMRTKFAELITVLGDKNAMNSFDLEHLNQVIHNYKVNGISTTATQISNNLMVIIEFLLKDEADLLGSLDTNKL